MYICTVHSIAKHNVKVEKVADTKNVDASEEVNHILNNEPTLIMYYFTKGLSSFQGVGKKVLKEHHIQKRN